MGVLDLARQGKGLKAAANAAVFPSRGQSSWPHLFGPGTRIDYNHEVGRLQDNSIVEACLGCMVDLFVQARPYLSSQTKEGGEEKDFKHPLIKLLRRPNKWYGDKLLWSLTIADRKANQGNAYWHILKNAFGVPVELYWMPADLVEPKWNESDPKSYITHYEYNLDGRVQRLEVDEVIHFREGVDPSNIRKGYPRLKSALRHIFIDNEAAATLATTMKNRAIFPVAWSPDFTGLKDTNARGPTREEADAIEAKIDAKGSGDRRGKSIFHTMPVKAHQLSYALGDMISEEITRLPETRVCAIFRLPPGFVKMWSGLSRNTMANADTEDSQAWHNCIIPLQGEFCDDLNHKLAPMFGIQDEVVEVKFDTSGIQALKPDYKGYSETWTPVWEADGMTLDEYRDRMDLPVAEGERGGLYYSELRPEPVDPVAQALENQARALARERRSMLEQSGIDEPEE